MLGFWLFKITFVNKKCCIPIKGLTLQIELGHKSTVFVAYSHSYRRKKIVVRYTRNIFKDGSNSEKIGQSNNSKLCGNYAIQSNFI